MSRILVIDREVGICELLEVVLQAVGHQVTAAQSLEAAQEALCWLEPDLVLLDIGLLRATLQQQPRLKERAAIVLLAEAASGERAGSAQRNTLHIVEKPISLRRLFRSVEQALNGRLTSWGVPANGEVQGNRFRLSFELPWREARDTFERVYFERLLKREGENVARVAAYSGLERTYVYRKLQQLGMKLPNTAAAM